MLFVALVVALASAALPYPLTRVPLGRLPPNSYARVLRGSLARPALLAKHSRSAGPTGTVPMYAFSDAQYYGPVSEANEKSLLVWGSLCRRGAGQHRHSGANVPDRLRHWQQQSVGAIDALLNFLARLRLPQEV